LFVGEAPGVSEDIFGKPFYGPAGSDLDTLISLGLNDYKPVRVGFTNMVACIPLGEDGKKVNQPPNESVVACGERLQEIVDLCCPQVVVMVGDFAWKHFSKTVYFDRPVGMYQITHPAGIMRMDSKYDRDMARRRILAQFREIAVELVTS
jgi:uracil-DNA glycosylase family 4